VRYELSNPAMVALAYVVLEDKDNAFKSLRAAIDSNNVFLLDTLLVAEFWDPIRKDRRFGEMLSLLDSKVTHTEQYMREHNASPVSQ
jgi:hypothetical protein